VNAKSSVSYAISAWFGQPISNCAVGLPRKSHPQTTPTEVAEKVIEIALQHPKFGCCKLVGELKHHNILLSSPTIQKILVRQRLGSRQERIDRASENEKSSRAVARIIAPPN
jgi:hypothetical protein